MSWMCCAFVMPAVATQTPAWPKGSETTKSSVSGRSLQYTDISVMYVCDLLLFCVVHMTWSNIAFESRLVNTFPK